MSEQPSRRWRRRALLSDDVRQRAAVHVKHAAPGAALPLTPVFGPSGAGSEPAQGPPGDASADRIQLAREPEPTASAEGASPGQPEGSSPSAEQVAERVYELLRQDLRVERERAGWR